MWLVDERGTRWLFKPAVVRDDRRQDRPHREHRPGRRQVVGLGRHPARGLLAVLRLARRLGPARSPRRLPGAGAPLLADPRLRRLLELHAGRRGRRRLRRRAGARALRHGGAGRHRARGRRPVQLARRARRADRRQRAGQQRDPARHGARLPRVRGAGRGHEARPSRPPRSAARAPSSSSAHGGARARLRIRVRPQDDSDLPPLGP